MAGSDVENFTSDFALSAITPSSARPTPDVKLSSASQNGKCMQERPPLEVSNTSNYSGSQVPNAATNRVQKRGVFEESFSGRQRDCAFQDSRKMMTTSCDEHDQSSEYERPWEFPMSGGDRWIARRADKHLVDDRRKEFANTLSSVSQIVPSESNFEAEDEETVGETYGDEYVSQGLDECNFFEEIIDVDREAGFGEDDDFGGQEDHVKARVFHSTKGRPYDDEELSIRNRCREPGLSSDEDLQTNSTTLQLSLGGKYDHYTENGTEAASQIEGHIQDNGNSKSMCRNVTDHKWLTLGSSNEEEGSAQIHRDFWEEERLKVELEEVLMSKKKGRRMKHRLRSPHTNTFSTLRKNPEHIDHVMKDMLAELRVDGEDVSRADGSKHCRPSIPPSETSGNSYKFMVMAFEELLREVEATANKNNKKLDDVLRVKEEEAESMQQERKIWFDTENQLRSCISNLETQHGRLSDMLRETAGALTAEKERRKDCGCELDRVMDMLIKEKKLHHETAEKFSTHVSSSMKLRESLAALKSSADDGGPLYLENFESVLNDMERGLQCNLNNSTQKTLQSQSGHSDIDELNRLRHQRNAAEAERDQIEERLSTLLRETRDGHGEMEALWLEREKLLEQKVECLEAELRYVHSKSSRKEAEVMIERQRWADELEKCMQAWARERNAWEAKLKDATGDRGRWKATTDASESRAWARHVVAGGGNEIQEGGEMVRKPTHTNETTDPVHDAAYLESHDQICVEVGKLALGTEGVVEIECDDQKLVEVQRDRIEEWRILAEQYKQERQETEKKLSATLVLVTNLEHDIKTKEVQMEEERKQLEALLANKSTEVANLKQNLKSKERELEVTIQKFTDELKLIDKEVERERKEREQVMELHFASKRQLVCDIKAKEESWEKALEMRNNELQMIENQVKSKQKDVEELQRKVEEEKSLRERTALELIKEKTVMRKEMEEMLADIWKLCEEEKIQLAVANKLLPGGDLSLRRPMWESLWLEYCRARDISDDAKVLPSTLEWEFARGKVSRFEKQITEAMSAIKSLRDEVKAKEEQLLKVKADREREWEQREEGWAQERERLLHLVESLRQKEAQLNEKQESREHEYGKNIDAMEELRKIEHEEASAIIASLRGSTRELEWCLRRTNSLPSRGVTFPSRNSPLKVSISHSHDKSNELVQVHASYLEELDRYIFDLERRKVDGERSSRSSQIVNEGECNEPSKEEGDMNNALMQLENELPTTSESEGDFNPFLGIDDYGHLSPRVSREWSSSLGGPGSSASRGSRRKVVRPLERGMCLTLNGLHTSTQESPWTEEADRNLPIWQPESHVRLGPSGSFNGTNNSWMSDEMQSYPGSPGRGYIALPGPSTSTRRPQKWLVDVTWLEQVRKEHAWLRQQLEIERQRVSALGRVEADNRWIEAAIVRALELKRQSDTKAAEMQRKLAAMETLFSARKRGTSSS